MLHKYHGAEAAVVEGSLRDCRLSTDLTTCVEKGKQEQSTFKGQILPHHSLNHI